MSRGRFCMLAVILILGPGITNNANMTYYKDTQNKELKKNNKKINVIAYLSRQETVSVLKLVLNNRTLRTLTFLTTFFTNLYSHIENSMDATLPYSA